MGQGAASPPTARALDVVELLAARSTPIRLADLSRDLGITTATAHAIVTTLCERGWAVRDPRTRSIAVGPALQLAAVRADAARPVAQAAREAAAALGAEFGYDTSVTERIGTSLLLTFYERSDGEPASSAMGDRIPFAAPFGAGFAAWATRDDQRAWIEHTARDNAALTDRLAQVLADTRERGYSLERMTPALAQTAQLVAEMSGDQWAHDFRRVVQEALLEVATDDDNAPPVFGIVAPVFDANGIAVLNVGVHPYRELSARQLARIGARVVAATRTLSA